VRAPPAVTPKRLRVSTPEPRRRVPRRFIRHPAEVPIEVRTVSAAARRGRGREISHGGLSFHLDEELAVGSTVEVRIPDLVPPFTARARVVWSRLEDGRYCMGVAFLGEDDAFRARMVEQVCAIERYRADVHVREGRALTRDEAAAEWITRFAGRFPAG
jgi:hypothetical protein